MEDYVLEIILKCLGFYCLMLMILCPILNLITCYVCMRKHLKNNATFKLTLFGSLSDVFTVFGFNLSHFTTTFLNIDYTTVSIVWCRLNWFIQYVSLQYSAWILVYFHFNI